jgi:hypothetical protein
MREIAHNWISSVRIKVNASRIAAATASAAQSEDRSANQKTTFFDSIGREEKRNPEDVPRTAGRLSAPKEKAPGITLGLIDRRRNILALALRLTRNMRFCT